MVKIKVFALTALLFLLLSQQDAFCLNWLSDLKLHGFAETAYGAKIKKDTTKHNNFNMLEQRLQLKAAYDFDGTPLEKFYTEFNYKGDFTVDEYYSGKTEYDTRELNIFLTPSEKIDLKIGRQILTWGTGDYLFINDLFPKDYVSFYAGRQDEYLKKPSDAVRVSLYSKYANLDVTGIPFFEPNTLPKGDRISFFDPFQGGIAGRKSGRYLIEPPYQFNNTELAARLYRSFGSYETAGYFFKGFYKSPRGYKNEALRQLYYPPLNVYGASIRGPVLSGIGNIECGYYDSREDGKGTNRLIENSSFKIMAGYDKDFGNDLRIGLQYLYEQILDYNEYKAALLPADFRWDEYRHLLTMRITQLFMNQTMRFSFFSFYSPSDADVYLRPSFEYDINDKWKVSVGGNFVWGRDDYTEFGQFENNRNIYTRLRYSF